MVWGCQTDRQWWRIVVYNFTTQSDRLRAGQYNTDIVNTRPSALIIAPQCEVCLYNSLQSGHVGRLWQTGDPILVELSLWPPSSLLQLFLLNLGHEKMPRHEATANIPRTAFIIWWLGTTHNLLYVVILYGKMGQLSDINKYCWRNSIFLDLHDWISM